MELFKQKQTFKPIDRVIIFAHDQSEKYYADIVEVEKIEDGRIVTSDEQYVLPLSDATIFNTQDGILYAYNMSIEYLKEVMHLAEVEKNIIVGQAFLYPGRQHAQDQKSNMMMYIMMGILGLIAIIAIFA